MLKQAQVDYLQRDSSTPILLTQVISYGGGGKLVLFTRTYDNVMGPNKLVSERRVAFFDAHGDCRWNMIAD